MVIVEESKMRHQMSRLLIALAFTVVSRLTGLTNQHKRLILLTFHEDVSLPVTTIARDRKHAAKAPRN